MAISMKDLKKEKGDEPPRSIIYGPEGLGKTTLASEWPKPIFLQVEKGTPAGLSLDSFGQLSHFDQLMSYLELLYKEEHQFLTAALDSTSVLEQLIFAKVCEVNRWDSIESPGYGRGYKEADIYWLDLIGGMNALRRDKGMQIVYITHSDIKRFDDPATQSYSRYQLSLHDRAAAILSREVDNIFLVKQEVTIKADGNGKAEKGARVRGEAGEARFIYTQQRPAFAAKNRYGMPDKILYERGKGYAALAEYFPGGKKFAGVAETKTKAA